VVVRLLLDWPSGLRVVVVVVVRPPRLVVVVVVERPSRLVVVVRLLERPSSPRGDELERLEELLDRVLLDGR
jgi:hypothetical protein